MASQSKVETLKISQTTLSVRVKTSALMMLISCEASAQQTFSRRRGRFQQVMMMPHVGSATVATRDAMGFRALDNVDAFFAGDIPKDLL